MVYSSDGSKLLVTHWLTDNLVVFDAATHEVLGAVDVGRYPIDVVATGEVALVPCFGSNEVWIIDLTTFETITVGTHGLPVRAALSPDGQTGYVGTALVDDLFLEAIDLATGEVLWSTDAYDTGLGGWIEVAPFTNRTQTLYLFHPLVVLPDGRIVSSGYDLEGLTWNRLEIFDPEDGSASEIPAEGSLSAARVSNDGSSLVVVEKAGLNYHHAVRFALPSLEETARIPIAPLITFSRHDIGLNGSGTKALVPSGTGTTLVRFKEGTATTLNAEETNGTPGWFGTSPSGHIAVVGALRTRLFDFENEEFTAELPLLLADRGAVSPSTPQLAFADPTFLERLHFASYDEAEASLSVEATVASASPSEPDAPHRIALTPDGRTALVAHFMPEAYYFPLAPVYRSPSTLAIVDLTDQAVAALLEIETSAGEVEVSPDGRWALAFGVNAEAVQLIDVEARQVVARLPLGPGHVAAAFAPDGSEVYLTMDEAASDAEDALRIIEIGQDGTLTLAATIPTPGIGPYYYSDFDTMYFTAWSDVAVSADGDLVLVAAPDTGSLHLIESTSRTLVQTLAPPGAPFALAVTDHGTAVVAPRNGTACAIIQLGGTEAEVVATPPCPSAVMDIAYASGSNRALVASLNSSSARWVDVEAGTSQPVSLPADFRTIGVEVRSDGTPLFLGLTILDGFNTGALLENGNLRPLPNLGFFGRDMVYSPALNQTIIATPGPDELRVFDALPVANSESPTVQPFELRLASANPSRGPVTFSFDHQGGFVELTVFDLLGRHIQTLTEGVLQPGTTMTTWRPGSIAPGVYLAHLHTAGGSASIKFTLLE